MQTADGIKGIRIYGDDDILLIKRHAEVVQRHDVSLDPHGVIDVAVVAGDDRDVPAALLQQIAGHGVSAAHLVGEYAEKIGRGGFKVLKLIVEMHDPHLRMLQRQPGGEGDPLGVHQDHALQADARFLQEVLHLLLDVAEGMEDVDLTDPGLVVDEVIQQAQVTAALDHPGRVEQDGAAAVPLPRRRSGNRHKGALFRAAKAEALVDQDAEGALHGDDADAVLRGQQADGGQSAAGGPGSGGDPLFQRAVQLHVKGFPSLRIKLLCSCRFAHFIPPGCNV